MNEEWKIIPGYESYQVSNLGRVKNFHGKIMKQNLNGSVGKKYFTISIFSKNSDEGWEKRKKTVKIHRLVLLAFIGEPKEGQIACHKNDIKTDNRLENLYWGTRKDNARDSIRLGNFFYVHPGFGDKHSQAKYSNELIKKLRKEYTGKRGNQKYLSSKYGIPQKYVSDLIHNKVRA